MKKNKNKIFIELKYFLLTHNYRILLIIISFFHYIYIYDKLNILLLL